jgi:hypothetical protein
MTFKDALHILSTNIILKIALPKWATNLTKHTREVNQAFIEIKVRCSKVVLSHLCFMVEHWQQYMLEMVEARRNADTMVQHHDLFNGLLDAVDNEPDNGVALSDDELIGGDLTSQSLESVLPRLPRKHVYLSYCWT